jgi:hypothetical protein
MVYPPATSDQDQDHVFKNMILDQDQRSIFAPKGFFGGLFFDISYKTFFPDF